MAFDYECGTCGGTFPAGWRARDNHCNSTGHSRPSFECDVCARWFGSQLACNQHMRDTGHWPTVEQYECACCYDTWPTEERRTEHEHQHHSYCAECNRTFQSFNNLTMVRPPPPPPGMVETPPAEAEADCRGDSTSGRASTGASRSSAPSAKTPSPPPPD